MSFDPLTSKHAWIAVDPEMKANSQNVFLNIRPESERFQFSIQNQIFSINSSQMKFFTKKISFFKTSEIITILSLNKFFNTSVLSTLLWEEIVKRNYSVDYRILKIHNPTLTFKTFFKLRTRFQNHLQNKHYQEEVCKPSEYELYGRPGNSFDVMGDCYAYTGILKKKTVCCKPILYDTNFCIVFRSTFEERLFCIENLGVESLLMLPNRILGGCENGEIVSINLQNNQISMIPFSKSSITSLLYKNDTIITASKNGNINLLKVRKEEKESNGLEEQEEEKRGSPLEDQIEELQVGRGGLFCIAVRGYNLACGAEEGISILSLRNTALPPIHFPFKGVPVTSLNWDSDLLYSGDESGMVTIWNPLKGEALREVRLHNSSVTSIQVLEKMLISAEEDGWMKVADVKTLKVLSAYRITSIRQKIFLKMTHSKVGFTTPDSTRSGVTFFDFSKRRSFLQKIQRIGGDSQVVRTSRFKIILTAVAIISVVGLILYLVNSNDDNK